MYTLSIGNHYLINHYLELLHYFLKPYCQTLKKKVNKYFRISHFSFRTDIPAMFWFCRSCAFVDLLILVYLCCIAVLTSLAGEHPVYSIRLGRWVS